MAPAPRNCRSHAGACCRPHSEPHPRSGGEAGRGREGAVDGGRAPDPPHLGCRGVPEIDAIGEVEVGEVRACPGKRGEARGAEPPGAGEVEGADG